MNYRPKTLVSLLGTLRLERHYYHCADCGHGFCPWDTVLRLTPAALSPAAEEVTALVGCQTSFAEGSERTLTKLAGLHLSESTVERTTEAAGERVAAAQAAGETFGPAVAWAWHRDAEGKTCAYVSTDATGVGQQGPQGAKAEGRMVQLGMLYNPIPEDPKRWAKPDGRRPPWQARYVAGLDGLAALGEPLRRQGAQIGMDRAERWIALSDGGSGLEDFLRVHFPRVEAIILDFYHVAEHLNDFAKVWHARDEAAATAVATTWCHQLKHEGGGAVQATLQALDLRGRTAAVREAHRQLTGYFAHHVHRMD